MTTDLRDPRALIRSWGGAVTLFVAVGCSHAPAEILSFREAPAKPGAAGVVTLRPESQQFVSVETVGSDSAAALVRSPGRVAFRDGAVARVGAPVHGRVASVLVHVGDHVRRGDRLVILTSPDAATMQADLQRAEVDERAASAEDDVRRTGERVIVQQQLVGSSHAHTIAPVARRRDGHGGARCKPSV